MDGNEVIHILDLLSRLVSFNPVQCEKLCFLKLNTRLLFNLIGDTYMQKVFLGSYVVVCNARVLYEG